MGLTVPKKKHQIPLQMENFKYSKFFIPVDMGLCLDTIFKNSTESNVKQSYFSF